MSSLAARPALPGKGGDRSAASASALDANTQRTGTSLALTAAEKQKIKELYDLLHRSPDITICISLGLAQKFLLARKGDIIRASDLALQYTKTYGSRGLVDINPDREPQVKEQLLSQKFILPGTCCRDGCPLLIFVAAEHRQSRASVDSCVRALVFLLTSLTDSLLAQRKGVTIVFDLTGVKTFSVDYGLLRRAMDLLLSGFPGRLHKAILLNCPLWARSILKMATSVMKSKIKQRIIRTNDWKEHIGPDSYPSMLGGHLHFTGDSHRAKISHLIQAQMSSLGRGQQLQNGNVCPAKTHVDAREEPARFTAMSASNPVQIRTGFSSVSARRGRRDRRAASALFVDADLSQTPRGMSKVAPPPDSHRNMQLRNGHVSSTAEALRHSSKSDAQDGLDYVQPDSAAPGRTRLSTLNVAAPRTLRAASDASWRKDTSNPFAEIGGSGAGVAARSSQQRRSVQLKASPSALQQGQEQSPRRGTAAGGSSSKYMVTKDKLTDYVASLRTNPLMVLQQFGELQEEEYPRDISAALHVTNRNKNRYKDILPYDKTRFVLTDTRQDYINANFIHGFSKKCKFIAAQGPLLHTSHDFWLMVYQSKTCLIIMTTREEERGKEKCFRYWPDCGKRMNVGPLVISGKGVFDSPRVIERLFEIRNSETGAVQEVKHFQYIEWPDHGVPTSPSALVDLHKILVKETQERDTDVPIVVHCSAGIGRTGTLIALDICLDMLRKHGKVSVYNVVKVMRQQRMGMVQTPEQFLYLHEAVLFASTMSSAP